MANFPIYKLLIAGGILFIVAGLFWYFFADKLHWFGKLPGDFRYEGENSKFYFPFTTMLLISVVINLVIWLLRRFF